MPELPEVETIARQLRGTVLGRKVASVTLSGKPLRKPIAPMFAETIQGREIKKILRQGKYLIAVLKPRAFILIHLGMSGRILFHPSEFERSTHTHAVFRLSDDSILEYRDTRRFGMLAVYDVPAVENIPEIALLGKDPLLPGFNGRWLADRLKKSRRSIKSFLLDQRVIAGLGNIYACESLYRAGIHPVRRCCTLSADESVNLVEAVKFVLRGAIQHKGTSFSDFIDSDGNKGTNQRYLTVFQREGRPCPRCGTLIKRKVQEGRSSFFCPDCQP
jgi:formamidopyrimidine-DNA glycosylase